MEYFALMKRKSKPILLQLSVLWIHWNCFQGNSCLGSKTMFFQISCALRCWNCRSVFLLLLEFKSGLLWEVLHIHIHFLGLNVLILVQNQLSKHHVECVFSSSIVYIIVHYTVCVSSLVSPSYVFALFCSLIKSVQSFHSVSYFCSPLCNLYFNDPFPSFPCCSYNFYFPVCFVGRLFHIIIFIPLCFLLLVKQFSVLLCRITLYDYQAMCRTNKESSDSAHSLLDVSIVNFLSTFPCNHQRKYLMAIVSPLFWFEMLTALVFILIHLRNASL